MMAVLVILLTPLNQLGMRQYNTERILPDNKIEFLESDKDAFAVGDHLPIYRFNPEWQKPIGEVEVLAYDNGSWLARYDPKTFRWPMANQGAIIKSDAQFVYLNVGQSVGVKAGDTWHVFAGSEIIGKVIIHSVTESESVAQLVQPFPGLESHSLESKSLENQSRENLVGLHVSPYYIANQIIVFDQPWIRIFQITVLLAAFAVWVWSIFSKIPGKVWYEVCQTFRDTIATVSTTTRFRTLAIIGVPISFGLGVFTWNILCYVNWYIHLALLGESVEQFPTFGTPWMQIIFSATWYAVLFGMRRSPISYAVEKIRYQPMQFTWLPPQAKPYVLWFLHLFVYYAFTNTLGKVVVDNMQVMVDHAWPTFRATAEPTISAGFLSWVDLFVADFSSTKHLVDRFYELFVYMSTNAATISEPATWFVLLRLGIWSLTICVSLCLYTYTVICILWTRTALRNIDFTLAGWVSTAVCYGPLLGAPLHHSIPSANGLDPTYVIDLWMWITLTIELLLNVLYMLSIFNMGLKFGVMVDKGVRTSGFYAVIRHPSYLLEALMFVIIGLIALSGPLQWFAISVFFVKYWLRSEREDQFMSGSNPDFLTYKQQTPWKFIPGLY
jgi:hypothetical protein